MNSKTCIDQWLYYHLKKKTFSGLVWGNKQLQFQITWEKHGTKGYEKTFEICKVGKVFTFYTNSVKMRFCSVSNKHT